jgi:hypothetical protein
MAGNTKGSEDAPPPAQQLQILEAARRLCAAQGNSPGSLWTHIAGLRTLLNVCQPAQGSSQARGSPPPPGSPNSRADSSDKPVPRHASLDSLRAVNNGATAREGALRTVMSADVSSGYHGVTVDPGSLSPALAQTGPQDPSLKGVKSYDGSADYYRNRIKAFLMEVAASLGEIS